jgi:hypothetical protein
MVYLVLILVIITISSFILFIRCTKIKHNKNYNRILELTKRLEEVESKLHLVVTDYKLYLKKYGDL